MGLLSHALVQVVVASVLLGALKRAGIVRIDANAIQDERVRKAFTQAVDLGESIAEKGSVIADSLKKAQ
ncbi:hypothetical protein M9434_001263 [Picochlorum sp. BPE23]|nr:hypothetical protein M9434_001263 [Picochlorum sp. BPE23]KAI8112009.1 hypothetical protein M9435_004504 [Picochlorum sp. BPE23]|eukprot:jgi/Picre1/33619/NNA_001099.t1